MMQRRSFLAAMLAASAAPAIVRAESLMKIWVPTTEILLPHLQYPGLDFEFSSAKAMVTGDYLTVTDFENTYVYAATGLVIVRDTNDVRNSTALQWIGTKRTRKSDTTRNIFSRLKQ